MDTLVIRADAALAPEIGTGHLVRSVALARAIRGRDPRVRTLFFTSESLPDEKLLAEFRDCAVLLPTGTTEADLLARLGNADVRPDRSLVLFDTLGVSRALAGELRRRGHVVVTLDDGGEGAAAADISINGIVRRPGTYSGYSYLLLPHPPRAAELAPRVSGHSFRIFLSFGGNDQHGILPEMLRALLPLAEEQEWEIEAVAAYPESVVTRAEELVGRTRGRVHVQRSPSDYLDRLQRCDIALVSGGLTLFSALHYGLPSVVVAQYPHQLESARSCEQAGAAVALGLWSEISPALVTRTVRTLADDGQRRLRMSRQAAALIDGRGAGRVVEILFAAMRLLGAQG